MWIRRVLKFSKQMFPLYPNVVIFLVQFAVSYGLIARYFQVREINWLELLFGGLTSVGFVYLLRVFDEIKDYPTDLVNFPDRPIVAGVVSLADVRRLWIATTIGMCLLQLPFLGNATLGISFLIVLGYSFLAFKWFFFERQIRASLPLALLSHNPIVYLYQLYVLSFFGSVCDGPLRAAVLFLVGDAMVGTAWELSRKIRGTTEEDTYVTYSRLWGPFIPVCLVAVILAGSFGLTYYSLSQVIQVEWVLRLWILPAVVWLVYLSQAVRYVLNPARAPKFKLYVESFKSALLICYGIAYLFGRMS